MCIASPHQWATYQWFHNDQYLNQNTPVSYTERVGVFTCKLEVMNVFEDDFEESVNFTVSVSAGVHNDNISVWYTVKSDK